MNDSYTAIVPMVVFIGLVLVAGLLTGAL